MRSHFREFFALTDLEKDAIWSEGVFVFDTNVLLNLYRMSQTVSGDMFQRFEALKGRLFLPHQVLREFFNNRESVISEQVNAFESMRQHLEKLAERFRKDFHRHPTVPTEQVEAILNDCSRKLIDLVKESQDSKPINFIVAADPILERLDSIFADQCGVEGPEDVTRTELDRRLTHGIFPCNKQEHLGDGKVWLQILDFIKETKKPLAFVTSDKKENWWRAVKLGNSEKKIGPHCQLVREITDRSQHPFAMYDQEDFLKASTHYLKLGDESRAVKEVQQLQEAAQLERRELATVEELARRRESLQGPSVRDMIVKELAISREMLRVPSVRDMIAKEATRRRETLRVPAVRDMIAKEAARRREMLRVPTFRDMIAKEAEGVQEMSHEDDPPPQ